MAVDAKILNDRAIESLLNQYNSEEMLIKSSLDLQKKTNQRFSYSGMSKRKFVIEETNWGDSLETRKQPGYSIASERGTRYDNFRHAAGKYWGYDVDTSDNTRQLSLIHI